MSTFLMVIVYLLKKDIDILDKELCNYDYESLLIEVIEKMSAKYGRQNAINSIKSYLKSEYHIDL